MLFDSKLKHTVRIDPKEDKEIALIDSLGLEVGREYETEDNEFHIMRIILPMYAETKDTKIIGKRPDGSYVYSTPEAVGTQCAVLYRDKDKKWGSCSPSEFGRMLKKSSEGRVKSKKAKEEHGPFYMKNMPKPTADQIKKTGEDLAKGGGEFMKGAAW